MVGFILTLHFIVCIFMIIIILFQAGKGAEVGAAFGGSSQTVFGPRGAATFLSKLTTVSAIIFLLTSIYLANISKSRGTSSVLQGTPLPTPPPATETAPTAPAAETQPEMSVVPETAPAPAKGSAPKAPETKPKHK